MDIGKIKDYLLDRTYLNIPLSNKVVSINIDNLLYGNIILTSDTEIDGPVYSAYLRCNIFTISLLGKEVKGYISKINNNDLEFKILDEVNDLFYDQYGNLEFPYSTIV